jgi:hypothetical protein
MNYCPRMEKRSYNDSFYYQFQVLSVKQTYTHHEDIRVLILTRGTHKTKPYKMHDNN